MYKKTQLGDLTSIRISEIQVLRQNYADPDLQL
jgi:hypothetical protein